MDVYAEISDIKNKTQICNANRVYINPNFNHNSYPTTNNQVLQGKNISMHVNPKFSTAITQQNKNISNARIFINPNFVKSLQGQASKETFKVLQHNLPDKVDNNPLLPNMDITTNERNLPIFNVNKSRYSLVRQGTIKVKENIAQNPSKTIKISKYKSVPLSDIKNSMTIEHNSSKSLLLNVRKTTILPQTPKAVMHSGNQNKYTSRYKYTKYKKTSVAFNESKTVITSKPSVGMIKKNYKVKVILAKKMLKKNNIPCPLFKKFGKCIRDAHGNCEFSHDKKHVSLCRKFLKGICFDSNCLLSHDLTNNKMPTCYFYLKGMCTKEDCPYVHVKLNDNTKICPDFLKGYCEKGKKCVNRHVTVTNFTKKHSYYKYKKNEKLKVRKKSMCYENKPTVMRTESTTNNSEKQEGNLIEGRYYEDQAKWDDNINDTSEVIKPTRCKLGNLPSFIQLPR
ncbi:uncharacterized protein LOC115451853 isoform X1 [Manduca sexta]|uniref:uncharacterized protein LOC115451853 isoform X1 n=1 Tax=Manduca sexta TaxID=7130 RepID=UPI00118298C0|nr:uncharacterized protein LOC115451853 isoform X1 [Manduca sexta]XP_037294654.1 uncharacterized protein LOC115451853 isoform X1 [Manduca sexta]